MNNITINNYENKTELFFAVAQRCEEKLKQTLNDKNSHHAASFIIPGGTTPAPAFEQLSKSDLNWSKVTIAQSDERWICADLEHSNQYLTKKTLLINNAKKAHYIAMKNNSSTASEGQNLCNNQYQKLVTPFSLTMLGMGLDGHIASLFPNSKTISDALDINNNDLCIAIDGSGCPVAGDYPERMSLTLAAILKSELIILLITGNEKMKVINKAMEKNKPHLLPVSGLLHQTKTAIEIFYCP